MNFAAMTALLDEALRSIPEASEAHKLVSDVRAALADFETLSNEACEALSDAIAASFS